MGNPYPATIIDDSGVERIRGEIDFTDGGNQPSGSIPTGAASPRGSVAPTGIGELYIDTAAGTLYLAVGVTNADWVRVGGTVTDATLGQANTTTTVEVRAAGAQVEVDPTGAHVLVETAGLSASLWPLNGKVVEASDDGAGHGTLGFYGTGPIVKPAVTGALSTVVDASAKAVLTSIIAELAALGLITDSTT